MEPLIESVPPAQWRPDAVLAGSRAACLDVRYGCPDEDDLEIAESLLREAKAVASQENTTLRALIDEGLRCVLASRRREPFKLRKASIRGKGLQPGVVEGDWACTGRGS